MSKYQDPLVVGPANGVTRGDDRSYPDRGTSSGFVGEGAPYGADVSANATNRRGGFTADSDSAFDNTPRGDAGTRFSSSGHSHTDQGGSDVAADSDPAAKVSHDDQRQ